MGRDSEKSSNFVYMEGDSTPILLLEPAEPVGSAYYQVFQRKTVTAAVIIVLIGSACNKMLPRVEVFYRCTRPDPSPPASFSTSATVTRLKSPSMECFNAEAATANSMACWLSFPASRA